MNPAPQPTGPPPPAGAPVNLAFVINGMVTTLLGPILPELVARWSLTDTHAGYFFTAQFTGNLLGVAFTSVLLPRFRAGACIGAGYALAAVGVAGVALRSYDQVLAAVFLYGVGLGLAIPASNLFVSELNPRRRAAALSVLNFMWGIGAVTCPMLISFAERRATLNAFLFGLAAALAVAAVATAATGTAPLRHPEAARLPFARLLTGRFGVALALMFFLYIGIETSLGGWVADLAGRVGGHAGSWWLLAPSFFWGMLLAGRAIAPLALRHLRERSLALAGLSLAAAGAVVLLLARSVPAVLAGSAIAGFGLASIFPITVALLAHYGRDERRAAGPMFGLGALGGAVLPWVVGFTSTRAASLEAGLLVPFAAMLFLVALHATKFRPRSACSHPTT